MILIMLISSVCCNCVISYLVGFAYQLKLYTHIGIGQKTRYDLYGFKDLSMTFIICAEKSTFIIDKQISFDIIVTGSFE